MLHDLKAIERGLKAVCGRVAVSGGTPSVVDGDGFTLVDVAAGKVRVTVSDPGKSILTAVANPNGAIDATAYTVDVEVESSTSVLFRVFVVDGTDGALVDNVGFHLLS